VGPPPSPRTTAKSSPSSRKDTHLFRGLGVEVALKVRRTTSRCAGAGQGDIHLSLGTTSDDSLVVSIGGVNIDLLGQDAIVAPRGVEEMVAPLLQSRSECLSLQRIVLSRQMPAPRHR